MPSDAFNKAVNDPQFYSLSPDERTKALTQLDPEFAGEAPDIQRRVVTQLEVRHGASQVGLDPALAGAISTVESKDNPGAVSPKGARGVMQVMPSTAASIPKQALPAGVDPSTGAGLAYMKVLQAQFGDTPLAIAAYNAGPGNVRNAQKKAHAAGGDPSSWEDVAPHLPAETQKYVPNVLARRGTVPPPEPTPVSAPVPAPHSVGRSYTPSSIAERFGKAVAYDGLVFPAAALNRLGYSLSIPGFKPPHDYVEEKKNTALGRFVGEDQLANLPQDTPGGFWGRLEALGQVAEPAYLPTFGTYIAARTWGADEQTARTFEMLAGVGALAEGGVKVAAGLKARQMIRNVKTDVETVTNAFNGKAAAAETFAKSLATRVKAGLIDAPSETAFRDLGQRLVGPRGSIVRAATGHAAGLVKDAYEAEMGAADEAGLALPRTSPQYLAMKQLLVDFEDLSKGAATPAQRAQVAEMANTLEGRGGAFLDAKKILALRAAGKMAYELAQDGAAPITYRNLRMLDTAMSRADLSPSQWATFAGGEGAAKFAILREHLDLAMESLSTGVPSVEEASRTAKMLAEQRIRLRESAGKIVGKTRDLSTPESAAKTLYGTPSHLLRLFQDSAPNEIEAIQTAGLHHIYTRGGVPDRLDHAKALTAFKKLPTESRRLLASVGSDEAQQSLFRSLYGRQAPDLNAKPFVEAERDQVRLLEAQAKAQKAAEGAVTEAEQGEEKVINYQRLGGRVHGQGNFMTRRSIITLGMGLGAGALGVKTGSPYTLISAGAFLYASMRWPKLVAEAIKTPLNTTHGVVMARALAGLLNGYYGRFGNHPAKEMQSTVAPQASPAPPPSSPSVGGPPAPSGSPAGSPLAGPALQ